jgi:hypothetical protein
MDLIGLDVSEDLDFGFSTDLGCDIAADQAWLRAF